MRLRESSGSLGALAVAPDADLVARAQRGEEDAFAALFETHKRRVYSLCLRMTRRTADAEDLTQETFLQVFRKIATFRGDSTFSTWLHRLTVNGVLMHLRRKRLDEVSLDEVDASQEEPVTREYRDDDRRLMGTIDRINLSEAIAHLPPGYRTALVLFDLEGYEHQEIAQMMNWSVGNSKSQLHKARRKLRDWLRLHGVKACSVNRAKVSPEYEAKKSSALRDRAGARGMNRLEARHFDPLNISAARQIELTNARRHIRCPATPLEGFFWLHVMLLTDRLQLRRLAPAWMVLLAFLLLGLLAGAEDSKSPSNDKEVSQITVRKPPIHTLPIQVDVNMVLLNVTVTDPYDRVVTGLEQSNFRVFDDKVEQEIASFSTEDAPISVGMIIDTSGSMVDKIQKSRQAVLQFFKTANPQDEFMLINFSERLNLVSGFTSKLEDLQARLLFVKAAGRTALLDAIYFGLGEMKKASTSRKALLIISDGGENHSRYTEKDIKQAVKEADVEMYAVGIFEPLASRARTLEEAGGPELLADLSQISGGRLFSVEDRTSCQILWRRFRLSCVTSTSLDTSPQTWSPMGAGGASRSS